MNYSELSDTAKRRLKYNCICPLCQTEITQYQNIHYIKYHVGRHMEYNFFHTDCLVNARNNLAAWRV